MRFRTSIIALAVAAALPSVSSAVEFSYNGFTTAGYSQLDKDDVVFKTTNDMDGIDSDGSFEYDSIIGLQGTVKFSDQWAFTAQGVVKRETDGDFGPSIDWAYLKWQPLSNLAVRAGLTRPPTFMFSDSIYVGYSNIWVRPPLEVYGISPVYQLAGVDAVWRTNLGPVRLTVQPYFGNSKLELPNTTTGNGEYELDVKDWYGLALTGEYGSFSGRIGWGTKQYDEELPSLVPLKTQLTAVGYADLAREMGMDQNKSPILNVGLQYDNATQFVVAEYAHRGTDSIVVPELSGAYLTFGNRFGSFTPYATVALLNVDSPRTNEDIVIPAPAPGNAVLRATLASLDATVDRLAGAVSDQNTYSLGLRYDVPAFSVVKGAVVKAQIDHIDPKDGKGFFGQAPVGFSESVNVYSLTFDFIF
ncbi:MAG TPA: porin [Povalibacter sp.]|uniref:porin n=1 Tax=Povalibacter sp. TaxID=1962978 RepID=UPI002BA033FE|nr:porin [Povalibacter sp.]HMN44148.1 porin [Povalibacter sp.]